ncbi:hypothetical protein KCX80_19870 [Paenibacillus mucilaginosus]|uniref:Fibronectin type-III domain-containing protein n=2 Tax=Paenibacillus mucilaginosus TaxID=61624 RepID=F8FDV1_PAEMK|nr:hypothetical protein KNP414_04621 [Paenibacillus mucilaginosus KNP414]WDM24756.1 hypothetical protein KCX80_19870 [Paenibacillus mucilaginosus]
MKKMWHIALSALVAGASFSGTGIHGLTASAAGEELTVPTGNTAFINDSFNGVTDPPVTSTSTVKTFAGYTASVTGPNGSVSTAASGKDGVPFPSEALLIRDEDGSNASGTIGSGAGATSVTKGLGSRISDGIVTVEQDMYFYGPNNDISRGRNVLKLTGGVNSQVNTSDTIIQVDLKGGKIAWTDTGGIYTNITPANLTNAAWYHLKAVINLNTFKADYYVTNLSDGSVVGELREQPFYNRTLGSQAGDTAAITAFGASTGGTTAENIVLDNIQVYKLNAPPDAPSGLTGIGGDRQIALSWSPAPNAVTYDVLRGESASGPFVKVAEGLTRAAASSDPFRDGGLVNGQTYYYVVRAVNPFGATDSAPCAITPSGERPAPVPPQNINVEARESAVMLKWDAVPDAATYTLKRAISPEGPFAVVSSVIPNTQTSYYDTGLDAAATYYYTLSSTNIAGTGDESQLLTANPSVPLAEPADLRAVPGSKRVDLSWTGSPGAAVYQVKRSTGSGGPYTVIGSTYGTSYRDTGAVDGQTYYYVVSAENVSARSMNTLQVRAVPYTAPKGAPAAPTGTVTEAAYGQIVLHWDAVRDASEYTIKRASSYNGPYTTIASTKRTSFKDTKVTNGSTYYYMITAKNRYGAGPASEPLIATPSRVIVVAKDGTGDFTTVQAAIDSVPQNRQERTVIYIKKGIYKEKVIAPVDKPNLSFVGESRSGVVITYDMNVTYHPGLQTATFELRGAGSTIENMTIQNSAFPNKDTNGVKGVGQALALYVSGDRMVFRELNLYGFQDTLYVEKGRQYFSSLYIEGTVDYIYGNGFAYFDRSEMKHVGTFGGYTTAASHDQTAVNGYVFYQAKKTRGTTSLKPYIQQYGKAGTYTGAWDDTWDLELQGVSKSNSTVYLGRPWRPYGNVKFVDTWMDAHFYAAGWHNWGKVENETTAVYGEYGSTGPGANAQARVPWSKQMTTEEANALTVQRVLGGQDGWDPTLTGVFAKPPAALGD